MNKHQLDKEAFNNELIHWYKYNKRSLPFRDSNNPYYIWVSEIMLQQTQVVTVIDYFNRFIQQFPNVLALSHAKLEDVLKAWEGLGYYSRAKNMHETAKTIERDYHGIFPNDFNTLLSLKGIGRYTAGAISSIAFHKKVPAIDGNVCRVMSRVLLIYEDISKEKTKLEIENTVQSIMPDHDPSSFNQGLMELGAMICKPKNPECSNCPVKNHCGAFLNMETEKLPIKLKKTKQEIIYLISGLIENDKHEWLMRKRTESLLEGMYEFVQIDGTDFSSLSEHLLSLGIEISNGEFLGEVKHVFTHRIWHIGAYYSKVILSQTLPRDYYFISQINLSKIPISTAHKKVAKLLKDMI